MTELIIALGQKSLYIGDNTRSKLFKGLNICREKMGTRYPGFTPRFWSESPNPNYYAQTRIAGIALSELVGFPEIYREVYFPTVEALIPLAQKVDSVVFLLWETPHSPKEFAEHWWDTATLAPVLKAYLSNQGVTNVEFKTIQVSSIDKVEEVQAQVSNLFQSSKQLLINVQDTPVTVVHAITKNIKESGIWQSAITTRNLGTMMQRSGGAEYIWLPDHRNGVLGRPITPFQP